MTVIDQVARYAEEVLRPAALDVDRGAVPASTIDDLRTLGALNHLAPVTCGGAGLGRDDDRRLHEILAGACFTTWLVWAQHASQFPLAVAAPAPGPAVGRLLRGELLAGAATSDVRRYPDRYVAATRTRADWTFDGTLTWVSGWGLIDAITVAAVDPETATVVTALIPVGDHMRATPLTLSVVPGSRTFRVRLTAAPVPAENVLLVQTFAEWRAADVATTCDARPYYFGLATTVLRELAADPSPPARHVATVWEPRIAQLRADAYGLADEATATGDGTHRAADRLAVKVAGGEALGTLTRALVVAHSGRAVSADDTAQLHARSAMFTLIQAQSATVREAQLSTLAR